MFYMLHSIPWTHSFRVMFILNQQTAVYMFLHPLLILSMFLRQSHLGLPRNYVETALKTFLNNRFICTYHPQVLTPNTQSLTPNTI